MLSPYEQIMAELKEKLGYEGAIYALPDAGNHSDEAAITERDGYDRRKVKVTCPECKRQGAPLCSPLLVEVNGGWRWVGCDHKEPYTELVGRCPGCRTVYRFTVYTPQ